MVTLYNMIIDLRLYFFVLIIILLPPFNPDLLCQVTFQHTFGGANHDHGRSVKQTLDGGYIIAGSTGSWGFGSSDVYVIKLDSLGIKQWSNVYGGTNIDWGYGVVQTYDSTYVICGYTNSFGAGGYDAYLLKIDAIGNVIWEKTFGGTDWDFGYSIQLTSDSGLIIAGETYSFGSGNNDAYLVKTDSNGNLLWSKSFGGPDKDYAKSAKQTYDGGFIIAGGTESFGAGMENVYLIRTDSQGDTVWVKTFGGDSVDYANSVAQTPSDSGFIVVGASYSYNNGNSDYYFFKTDSSGAEMWSQTINSFSKDDYEADVIPMANGQYAILGSSKSIGSTLGYDFQFMITDSYGWVIIGLGGIYGSFNNNELAASFDVTNDNGFVICGSTDGFGYGFNDIFVVKLDSAGHADSTTVLSFNDSITTYVGSPAGSAYSDLIIFPNPVKNQGSLVINNFNKNLDEAVEITIMDLSGRVLKDYKGPVSAFKILASDFEQGLYFICLNGGSKTIVKKFAVLDFR